MGTATANDRALNCCTATVTWLTGALVDIETFLHPAIAIWCGVVVDRGAARRNCLAQHADDCKVQRVELRRAQPVRSGKRMDLRAPERLIGVDVANPNDAALVEEETLDARAAMRNECAKGVGGERHCEWLNAMVGEERRRVRVEARGGLTVATLRDERNAPKRPNIPEAKLTTIVQREREANIGVPLRRGGQNQQLPRHAQVYEEQDSAGELHDDPLCATARSEDASTTNRIGERGGIGGRKIALTKDVGARNRGATDESSKITNDRLYLWQLRHGRTTASSRPIAGHSSPQR